MSEFYSHDVPGFGIRFEASRLRREHQELIGELTVRCSLPGAQTVNGSLTTADFNFSSLRSRQDRAKFLTTRAHTADEIDWFGLLECFTQKIFESERAGDPAVDIRTLQRPVRGDELNIKGLVFPRRHPSILFGDGGAAKSYTALFIAGELAKHGMNVALFDWELSGEEHRDRHERLFGDEMPLVFYCRCERSITHEIDRLVRVVREHNIAYAVFDSIAFACDGPPEESEIAAKYFRAIREIGIGGLHIAHVTKSREGSDQRPFGSIFWHNGARCTWYVEAAAENDISEGRMQLGFFQRKANLGALHRPVSLSVDFFDDATIFSTADIADSPGLAQRMSLRQRLYQEVQRGAVPVEDLSVRMDTSEEVLRKTVQRHSKTFIMLNGGRVALRDDES